MDPTANEHLGFASCADLSRQILRTCYPRLLDPRLISQEDMEAFLLGAPGPDDGTPSVDGKRFALEKGRKRIPGGGGDDSDATTSLSRTPAFERLKSEASSEYLNAWNAFIRVGNDGDACYSGFDDTTMLDFVSRGLDCRRIEEKRAGDFEPGHRIAVFEERTQKPEPEPKPKPKPEPPSQSDAPELPRGVEYLAVVAQLDVIDAMVAHEDFLGAFVHAKTMEDLGFSSSASGAGVVCVTDALPTACVFAVLNACEISGVAVLDASKRFLLGSLSVSDVRAFSKPDHLEWLSEPVGAFLREKVWPTRASAPSRQKGSRPREETPPSAYTVHPRASLMDAMRVMSSRRVHRVYVCADPRSPPTGVCTTTDVMRLFALDPETAEGRARLTW